MKRVKKLVTITLCLSLIQLIINNSNVEAQPTAPGFEVQTYTNVSKPANLSFDPSGVLYAGNGNNYIRIHRIDVGGSPAREYGDIPLWDPDAVVFDSVGTISGQPGSVLVGGIDGPASPTGYLAAILPDESSITIFGPGSGLINPSDMLFDSEGRLLIADAFAGKVFYSDDGLTLNTLIGNVYLAGALALDENGNIYLSRNEYREIRIYSPDATLLNDSFVTGLDIRGMDFGPSTPPWDGHLFAVSWDEGKLYRIDEIGTVTEIGAGFGSPPNGQDVEFGPDGAMYVSDYGNDVIYRIVPGQIQNPDNGHWYQRIDNTMGWHDAKAYCESLGGYLATIISQVEDDFVYNNLASYSPNEMVWLGATDETQEGTWEWVTGESWNFTNWDNGEPNNCSGIEHYLVYFTPNDPLGRIGLWNDLGEGNKGGCGCGGCIDEWYPMSTICEWDHGKPVCDGKQLTILGTEGHDVIEGTSGPDVIHGLGGHDVIEGKGGDDVICGGDGNDTIIGRRGNDIILGGGGNDTLLGSAGDDILKGGGGVDFLAGNAGNDTLRGNGSNDTLNGGSGTDDLWGGGGNDTCYDDEWIIFTRCEVNPTN